jgi:hypothetical protein
MRNRTAAKETGVFIALHFGYVAANEIPIGGEEPLDVKPVDVLTAPSAKIATIGSKPAQNRPVGHTIEDKQLSLDLRAQAEIQPPAQGFRDKVPELLQPTFFRRLAREGVANVTGHWRHADDDKPILHFPQCDPISLC